MDPLAPCPCCSGKPYTDCCQPYHQGTPARDPETLMRSRYCAFVLGEADYLQATWHPDTRPKQLALDSSPDWTSLRIVDASEQGDAGRVHFRAFYRHDGHWGCLEERSRFVRQTGQWRYLDGEATQRIHKPGRNDPCPCGSGKKFKVCCNRPS